MSTENIIRADIQSDIDAADTAYSRNPGDNTTKLQLTVQPAAADGATTGSVAVYFRAQNARFYEALLNQADDTPVVLTLAEDASVTRVFDLIASDVRLVPTGADGAWDAIVTWYAR